MSNTRCSARSSIALAATGLLAVVLAASPAASAGTLVAPPTAAPVALAALSDILGFGEQANVDGCNTYVVTTVPDGLGGATTRATVDGEVVESTLLPGDVLSVLKPANHEHCPSGECQCIIVQGGAEITRIWGDGDGVVVYCSACCTQPGQAPYCFCRGLPEPQASCGCYRPN